MAKQLTMRDIVKALLASGHQVEYRERKDGGIRVTMIDGVRFKSGESTGNVKARSIVGATLSEKRSKQLGKITIRKGSTRTPVSEATREKIKAINAQLKAREKALKKQGITANLGRIRIKQFREVRKMFGEKEAEAYLDKAMRYASGLAYVENIQAIIERLKLDAMSLKPEEASIFNELVNDLQAIVSAGAPNFKHEYLQHIIEWIYEREKGSITTEEMSRRIKPWINAGR